MLTPENNKRPPFYVRYFKLLVVLLFFILLVPGYLFFIRPEYEAYQENRDIFTSQEQSLAQKKAQLLEYKKNLMSYENINPADRQKIEEVLPYGSGEPDLYVNLASLASTLGAELVDLRIQINESKTGPTTDNLLIKDKPLANAVTLRTTLVEMRLANMSYAKVKSCFDLLEHNSKLLDVQSFNFNPAEGVLSLSLSTYYLK